MIFLCHNVLSSFTEMRHLIAIYALLFITWLFAGLHLAFGSLWMIITFTALNIILVSFIVHFYPFSFLYSRRCNFADTLDLQFVADHTSSAADRKR